MKIIPGKVLRSEILPDRAEHQGASSAIGVSRFGVREFRGAIGAEEKVLVERVCAE